MDAMGRDEEAEGGSLANRQFPDIQNQFLKKSSLGRDGAEGVSQDGKTRR